MSRNVDMGTAFPDPFDACCRVKDMGIWIRRLFEDSVAVLVLVVVDFDLESFENCEWELEYADLALDSSLI